MHLLSWTLTEEYAGTVEMPDGERPKFSGGLIRAGEIDLDTRELLDAGDGVITAHEADTAIVTALDGYAPLKRCPTPKGAEPIDALSAQPVASLRQLAHDVYGIAGTGRARKADIVAAIRAVQERTAEGAPELAPESMTVADLAGAEPEAPEAPENAGDGEKEN